MIRYGFDQLNHFVIVVWTNFGNVHAADEESPTAVCDFMPAIVLSVILDEDQVAVIVSPPRRGRALALGRLPEEAAHV